MIESDQSDKDSLNDSLDMNEHTKKRPREESVEDDKAHSFPKKLCTSNDKITFEENKSEYKSEINGSVANNEEDAKDKSISVGSIKDTNIFVNREDTKDTNISSNEDVRCADAKEKDINRDSHKNLDTKSENEKEIYTIDNVRETDTKNSTDSKYKDNIPVESETDDNNTKEVNTKNEEAKEDENNTKPKKKRDKSQIDDAEVVEGLELSVECASDRESSSSESEHEMEKKPKAKTIIVKAKPNDSELDVSSSEAEKSDSQDTSEVKSKQNIKKGKRKARTSLSKSTDGNSEENDDVSDEDYSPRTKRKLKKTHANKRKSSSESKGSHDRVKKMDQQVDEKVEEEEENSDTIDDQKTEQVSSMKKLKSSDRRIEMLKKYIRTAGIRVKSYNTVWAGCKSGAAKVRCLQELLEKNGVTGKPTLEKCKKVKELNEKLKDIAELNTSNIISEGRITRAQRKRETPTEHREVRSTLKRVLRVVDSDSE
ncbi:uncharacterized protein LOC117218965 [Megalopta genalis]|uniref:uncharacterized protein LOC117218965 n=1 Tax=Megalopta genalis TaxID=115081 RepID=UPI003FD208E5